MGKGRGQFISINEKRLKDAQVSIQNLKATIEASDKVAVSASGRFFQKMQSRSADVLRETKDYIRHVAVTETGRKRGKNKGRYESGDMHDNFIGTRGSGTKITRSGKSVRFFFELGWLEGMPNYTLFQEFGTRNGIVGMNALARAREEIQWGIEEELTKNKDALAKDIQGALLAHVAGWRNRGSVKLKNEVWREVLNANMNDMAKGE